MLILHCSLPLSLICLQGLLFTNPFVKTNADFKKHIEVAFPVVKANPSVVNYIADVLYPPVFDGSQAMVIDALQRLTTTQADESSSHIRITLTRSLVKRH